MARVEANHLGGLLLLLFLISAVTLGLAGWAVDMTMDDDRIGGENNATVFLFFYALIAGLATEAAVFAGLFHFRAWRAGSLAGAASLAILAWLLSLLALGFAAKQFALGVDNTKLEVLGAFSILLGFFNTVYVLGIHAGIYNGAYGLGY